MKLADSWKSYRAQVIPAGASSVQVEETEKAFYSGAFMMFHNLTAAAGDEGEPTQEELDKISALNDELNEFVAKQFSKRYNG